MRKTLAEFCEYIRAAFEQFDGVRKQIAEIHCSRFKKELLIRRIGLGNLAPLHELELLLVNHCCERLRRTAARAIDHCGHVIAVRLGADALVFCSRKMREQCFKEFCRVATWLVVIKTEARQIAAHEEPRINVVREREVLWQSGLDAEFAQYFFAKTMKCSDGHVDVADRQQTVDAFLHLVRSFVGECERKDVLGFCSAGLDEPRDALRDDRGFAGSGTGDNHERAVAVRDSGELFVVQTFEQIGHRSRSLARDHLSWRFGHPFTFCTPVENPTRSPTIIATRFSRRFATTKYMR